MTVLIPSLAVAGEIVDVPTNALSVNVTLPNPVSDYVLSGQLSTPTPCWLSGASGNVATFSFAAPADTGAKLTVIALPAGLSGLHSVVLPDSTTAYSVTVPTGQSVVPIAQWNTQVWYQLMGNTWTFFFSNPPAGNQNFSYLIVGPGQNTQIVNEPIVADTYTITLSAPPSTSFLPITAVTWNTAIGMTPNPGQIILQFTNGAPGFASTGLLQVNIPINVSIFPLPETPETPVQEPWIVSVITPDQWAQRMIALFPYPWLGDQARTTAGIAYALFYAIGTELNFVSQQLYYAWQACRLQTASNGALDLFSQDYFGDNLPRLNGESDNAFRARIKALLLQPQVTRQAIINAIQTSFPGTIVRAIEPWNVNQTGYFADQTSGYHGSYWDYDSVAIPSVWGNQQARHQGYLEIQLPQNLTELSYNLWGWDFGSAWDAETGYYFEPVQAIQNITGQINNLIKRITAQGTQIWVKYINGLINPFSTGGSYPVATGKTTINVQLPSTSGFYLFFTQLNQVIAAWPSFSDPISFNVSVAAPTPSGTILNFLAIENSTIGAGIAAINQGDTTVSVSGDGINGICLLQPLWNTSCWYTNRTISGVDFEFGTGAPVGTQANILRVPNSGQAGYHAVSADATSLTISLTVDAQNIPIVMPNWNTEVACTPDQANSQIHLTFSVPAPADGSGEVMYCSYNI